jgi:hypothetical protein
MRRNFQKIPEDSAMNASFHQIDRTTHLKVVVAALASAIMVIAVALTAQI